MKKPAAKFLGIFIILNFFSAFAQTPSNTGWQWQYPKPQGNTLRDIYVFSKDTAVAVGNLGTVIKTTNGGINWDVQHHAGGTDVDLCSVCFTDKFNGWSAGGIPYSNKSVLLNTTDGGKSWTEVKVDMKAQIDTTLPLMAVYFVDKDTGFAVGEDGVVIRTTDGGHSWNIRKMDNYIGAYLDIFFLNAITFTDKNTGFIVGTGYYGNEIYKTTDCGRSWHWNEQIIMPKIYSAFYDIQFVDKNNGFIAGDFSVFLKTTDGGNTWQRDTVGYYNYSGCFVDPLIGVVVGNTSSESFINKTTDGGQHWFEVGGGQITKDALFKVRFSDNINGWIVGGTGIIYRTTDGGSNWISQSEKSYQFNSIYFFDENTGWAVGDNGVILHTSNGGDNWEKQYQNDSLVFNSVQAIDNNTVIIVGNINDMLPLDVRKAIILRTNDSGLSWQRQTVDTINRLNSVCFLSPKVGWLVGSGDIYKTTDGGITWFLQYRDKTSFFYKIQFVNDQIGFVDGRLRTTDGGNNWEIQNVPSLSFPSAYFVNENLGWIVGDFDNGNNIYRSTNGGDNWSSCSITPPGYNFSIYFINETTGWISGFVYYINRTSIIMKTTDGGFTWFDQKSPCKNEGGLSDIFFIDENTGWAVGNGIIKTTDGGGVVSIENEKSYKNNIPNQIELYQNYPNPFNPTTIIEYGLNKPQHVKLKVFNILGQEIKTLVDKEQDAGNYKITWDPKGVASGVYFYQLRTASQVITKKMLLIR